uniref:Uncharacterized protein n=1 Tax=Cacopsylla melanoneura TaxID=428564 RepID=A0A8D8M3S3_9HEMI
MMEIDRYVLSLQRNLNIRSSYTGFDPDKDHDLLDDIVKSIKADCPFLETEDSQNGKDECARKIHTMLFLHTEFATSKYYMDDEELGCVIGILPNLNTVFYLLLVNKLNLIEYLKQMLFYSSEVVSNEVLEVINKNIKYYELHETLELYGNIIKIIYLKLKYLELEYQGKTGDVNEAMQDLSIGKTNNSEDSPQSDEIIIKTKYRKFLQNFKIFGFEFCNNLLNNSKLKCFEKDESIIFEGYLLLSHLQILIFCTNVECFQNNGENIKFNSNPCVHMSKEMEEFYQPFRADAEFNYLTEWTDSIVDSEIHLFKDCYGDLLYDLMKVLTPISSNSWIIFYDHDYGNGKTLQTEIGEHAYYLNELLKQAMAKGYEHSNIQQVSGEYLQHLCIKPLTEEDLILKSLPEELISAFQENSPIIQNRAKWLNSALRFFNGSHDEIMTIFESNLEHVSCGTVFCLHDMIMDRLTNEELELSEIEIQRLKSLLLNSLDHLTLSDQIKVVVTFVEKYQEELCTVFPSNERTGEAGEWLNVINNQSNVNQVCMTSLKHLLQAPHSTLTKLMNMSLKSKLDQSCMATVIEALVDTLLPHFGNILLNKQGGTNEESGDENRYFLLDYFSDVLDEVKQSLERGEISFLASDETQNDGSERVKNKEQDTNAHQNSSPVFNIESLSKLSEQDISNLKPMISLLYKKQVLQPSDMYGKCLKPEFFSVDATQYEYLSFLTDLILVHFEDNSDLAWSPANEQLPELFNRVQYLVDECTGHMRDFIKEKYFARQQLILLITLLLKKHKDILVPGSLDNAHPDWLKLFLNESSTLTELYGISQDSLVPFLCQFLSRASQQEWTALASKMSSNNLLDVLEAVRVLVQLVEYRTREPDTVKPCVNCLHQMMICFINVFKDIFLPNLLQASSTLSSQFKLDLFESLTCLLASFKSSALDPVKMFTILSLETLTQKLLGQLFTSSEVKEYEKKLYVLIVRIDYVNTRVKLVRSIQNIQECKG